MITRFKAWLEWRRRDRECNVVATERYDASWARADGFEFTSTHMAKFLRDGNGERWVEWESDRKTRCLPAELVADVFNWETHGDLPPDARRMDSGPKIVRLATFNGGDAA